CPLGADRMLSPDSQLRIDEGATQMAGEVVPSPPQTPSPSPSLDTRFLVDNSFTVDAGGGDVSFLTRELEDCAIHLSSVNLLLTLRLAIGNSGPREQRAAHVLRNSATEFLRNFEALNATSYNRPVRHLFSLSLFLFILNPLVFLRAHPGGVSGTPQVSFP